MQIVDEMKDYYGKRAVVYDASMGYDDPRTVERLAPVIGLMKTLLQGRSVLEIACGPCFWTSQISSAVKSIMATDYNASALEVARRKPLNWDKVTLQVADAYALPPFSKVFDACMAVDWFAHVPRTRFHEFLRGAHSKLTADAVVVFCDQTPGPQSLTELRDGEGNHLQERMLPDGSRYRVIKHFLTDEEFRSVFSPYSASIRIDRFPECRRVVVSYTLSGEQAGGGDAWLPKPPLGNDKRVKPNGWPARRKEEPMNPKIVIRSETDADVNAIKEVTIAAFKNLEISHHTEQFIIDALRAAKALTVSLVAEVNGRVIGHIAFSAVTISDGTRNWYGLGPVSVLPA